MFPGSILLMVNTEVTWEAHLCGMHYLADQREQAVAILYQNILLDIYGTRILGIMLGHCVFDESGTVRAKYFRHTLFNLDGRMLAKESGIEQHVKVDPYAVMTSAWEVLRGVRNHQCPIIEPLNEWSAVPVSEHFTARVVVADEQPV